MGWLGRQIITKYEKQLKQTKERSYLLFIHETPFSSPFYLIPLSLIYSLLFLSSNLVKWSRGDWVRSHNARFKMSVKWGIFQSNKTRTCTTPTNFRPISFSISWYIFYFLIYPKMQCNSQALCFYGYWSKLCHFLSTNIWLDDVYLTYLSPTLCFHWFLYNCSCKFLCCLLKMFINCNKRNSVVVVYVTFPHTKHKKYPCCESES